MKLSVLAKKMSGLADKVREYWDAELPKRHPDYPIVHPEEGTVPPPPEEQQLRDLLAGLSEDMVFKLVLIMRLGRGHFGTADLSEDFQTVKEMFDRPAEAVSLMMDNALLGDYLAAGLAELKRKKVDVDKMSFPPAKARK